MRNFLGISLVTLFCLWWTGSEADVPEDLLLYLPFDEGIGAEVADQSGRGFKGEGVDTKWADGKFGKALEFNGQTSHVLVPGGVIKDLQKDEVTMIAWFYLSGHDGYDGIVSMTGVLAPIGGQCCQYRIMVNPGLTPFFDVGEHADHPIGGFSFELEKWYHYAMTYDGKVAKIYVDGEVVGEVQKTVALPSFDTPILVGTGEAPGTHPTEGIIDEVWVFNRALSEDEIKEIMQKGPEILPVEPKGKLATNWGVIKTKY
jgi:hypothetical protein